MPIITIVGVSLNMINQAGEKLFNKGSRNIFTKIILLIIIFCVWILAFQAKFVQAGEDQKVKIYGFVGEFGTNKPLSGAKVGIVKVTWSSRGSIEERIILAETNSSGLFEAYVNEPGTYNFFAYCDYNSTQGSDYIPEYRKVNIKDEKQQLIFLLLPGASVNVVGDPFFSHEESSFSCKVNDESGILQLRSIVREIYGSRYETLANKTIFVPANIGFKIEVNIYSRYSARFPSQISIIANFTVPINGSYIYLGQGEQIKLDLKNYRLEFEANRGLPKLLEYTRSLANKVGVLSSYEKARISDAEKALKRGIFFISQGDYINAHADLYYTYLILTDVKETLLYMFQNLVISIYFITPLISISSLSLGAILFKDRCKRIFTGALIFVLLIMPLYYAHPGYTLLREHAYNPLAGTIIEQLFPSLLLVFSFVAGLLLISLPYTRGEKSDRRSLLLRSAIVAAFSLAAENLKRRKMRTILVMGMIVFSIFAFITLTSFSYETGFIVDKMRKNAPSNGLLIIQRSNESDVYPYGPVDPQLIKWINEREGVLLTVPLLKNVPQIGSPPKSLGSLLNPNLNLSYNIFGVLGIRPSLESKITGINRIVSMGRFLMDVDFNGILISQEAKNALKIEINDTIVFCGRNFVVVGIFDSVKLGEIIDLDGESILPQKIQLIMTQGGPVYLSHYVPAEAIVIILDQTASELPQLNMIVSRVNVQLLNPNYEEIFSLARSATLIFPRVESFISFDGEITHLYIGHRIISYGFGGILLLLILVSLNVCVMMLNSVYERRREIQILSILGLNPSQISAVFICEAFIMAFIAGSLGYFFSLSIYVFFNIFQFAPALKYKAEVFWSIIALCLSIITSVFGSLIPSLKASVMATPSLLRRFIVSFFKRGEFLAVDIPLRIKEKEIIEFFNFIMRRMNEYSNPLYSEERVDGETLVKDEMDPSNTRLRFIYKYATYRVKTENEIFLVKSENSHYYMVKLFSRSLLPWTSAGKKASVWQTAAFVRRLILEYTERKKIAIYGLTLK